MVGGGVQREIVPNSLYSLLFYFELFPKSPSENPSESPYKTWEVVVAWMVKVVGL